MLNINITRNDNSSLNWNQNRIKLKFFELSTVLTIIIINRINSILILFDSVFSFVTISSWHISL